MRVAMIPSAYRTIFFHAVAERLEQAGHQVFWLSPNNRWANWLFRHRVSAERVLDVSRYGVEWAGSRPPSSDELRQLKNLEAAGTLKFNDIVMMDPLLVRRSREHSVKYLATCERLVRDFIVSNNIQCVTAEQTWAFELLVGQVCVTLGIPHMMPHTVRIPDSRFGFFVGHRETELLPVREPTSQDREQAASILAEFRARRPKPNYMSIDRRVLKPELSRLRLLARHVFDLVGDRFDETSYRPAGLVFAHSKHLVRQIRNRASRHLETPSFPPERPYVFFPLHMQPEASIDIKGSPFTAQLELVRAMARTLPVTHELYVKEHTVALKTRPTTFYRDLARIPGVRVITPFTDSFRLIAGADLVVCVTGTAAYETAILGRASATIAPIFFDRIVARRSFDAFREPLSELLEASPPKRDPEIVEFLAWLLARSFIGVVGDALWLPDSLGAENLDRVATGFQGAFDSLTRTLAASR